MHRNVTHFEVKTVVAFYQTHNVHN